VIFSTADSDSDMSRITVLPSEVLLQLLLRFVIAGGRNVDIGEMVIMEDK
jgi:hypothetical protein